MKQHPEITHRHGRRNVVGNLVEINQREHTRSLRHLFNVIAYETRAEYNKYCNTRGPTLYLYGTI